ncbi:MAG: hypothetical protein EA383_06990 [Spirochaetaceae bacterium]|nr:MAG: hypothetical protein EA383_06990 [Spirochaetaceae bacterium]
MVQPTFEAESLPLRVLLVSPETAPITGETATGRAVSDLARSLRDTGIDARVLMPCLSGVDRTPLYRHPDPVSVELGVHEHFVAVLTASHPEDSATALYFVDHQDYFARGADGAPAAIERAAFLSASVFPVCRALFWTPHLLHLFTWQTAYAAVLARTRELRRGFSGTATVLSIDGSADGERCPTGDPMLLSRLGIRHEDAVRTGLYSDGGISLLEAGRSFVDLELSAGEHVSWSADRWSETYSSLVRSRTRLSRRSIR